MMMMRIHCVFKKRIPFNKLIWLSLNYLLQLISLVMWQVTASRLLQSKQTIPHYYLTVDTRVDKLME